MSDWCAEVEEQVRKDEREKTIRELWYRLKHSMGPGKHQQTLNQVVDEMRAVDVEQPKP